MRQQPKAGGGLLKNIARNRTNYLFLLPFGIVMTIPFRCAPRHQRE